MIYTFCESLRFKHPRNIPLQKSYAICSGYHEIVFLGKYLSVTFALPTCNNAPEPKFIKNSEKFDAPNSLNSSSFTPLSNHCNTRGHFSIEKRRLKIDFGNNRP